MEVDHVSIDAELFWQESLDQCTIAVHELPGCTEPPLIQKEIGRGKALSECEERNFATFTQVWVKLECEKMKPVPHGIASWYHGRLSNYTGSANTIGNHNNTGDHNSNSPNSGTGMSHSSMWKKIGARLMPS